MTGVWESAYVDSTVQTERTAAILTPNVLIISSKVDSGLSGASFFSHLLTGSVAALRGFTMREIFKPNILNL